MTFWGGISRQELLEQGQTLLREGDRCVFQAEVDRAKHLYGAAIDWLLEGGHLDAAMEACRKLIRIAPDVVRTRYTLAYLLIGRRRFPEAYRVLEEYAQRVEETGAHSYAVPRLSLLAHATEDASLRHYLLGLVSELGGHRPEGREWGLVVGDDLEPLRGEASYRERWERLLPVVLRQ